MAWAVLDLNTICLPDETNQLTMLDLSEAAQLGLSRSAGTAT